jgi:hypothetical protein
MTSRPSLLARAGLAALALALPGACTDAPAPAAAAANEPPLAQVRGAAPPSGDAAACWAGHTTAPARVETVTEQRLERPEERDASGRVVAPAVFRTETRTAIVQEREEIWFQTPCPPLLTEAFVTSLQRALAVRGLYRGPLTGEMDARTRSAVRAYQKARGLDSGLLALETAQRLGLAYYAPPPKRLT